MYATKTCLRTPIFLNFGRLVEIKSYTYLGTSIAYDYRIPYCDWHRKQRLRFAAQLT